jgi:hypothetical protein
MYGDCMGNSVRHTPILGFGKSDKQFKVATHRKLRRKVHALEHDPTVEVYPDDREVSNTRVWRKSPRSWAGETAKFLPQLMRK